MNQVIGLGLLLTGGISSAQGNVRPAPAICSDRTGGIRGRLSHNSGYMVPVPGAVVTCMGADGRTYGTISDTEGRFRLGMLPPGRYVLRATRSHGRDQWIMAGPDGIEVRAGIWTIATQPPLDLCGVGMDQYMWLEPGRSDYRFEPEPWTGLVLRP